MRGLPGVAMGGIISTPRTGSRKLENGTPQMSEFRSQVYRKRKLSDATLEKIIRDPYVQTEFLAFLHNTFSEQKLAFWLEVEAYQEIARDDLSTKQSKAAAIFGRRVCGRRRGSVTPRSRCVSGTSAAPTANAAAAAAGWAI